MRASRAEPTTSIATVASVRCHSTGSIEVSGWQQMPPTSPGGSWSVIAAKTSAGVAGGWSPKVARSLSRRVLLESLMVAARHPASPSGETKWLVRTSTAPSPVGVTSRRPGPCGNSSKVAPAPVRSTTLSDVEADVGACTIFQASSKDSASSRMRRLSRWTG